MWNDEDDDFGMGNMSEDEEREIDRQIKAEDEYMRNHPMYKQSNEILDMVVAIIESLPENEREMHSPLLESAYMLGPKFAGACNCGSWLLAMQNAALIRYHAEYIATGTYGFNMFGEEEVDSRYVALLQSEMKKFRVIFNVWVREINAMEQDEDEMEDEWGLFVRGK